MAIDMMPPPVTAEPTIPAEPATPAGPSRPAARMVCSRLAALAAVAAALALYVMHTALPTNPLSASPQEQVTVRMFLPEGWGFFTISPRLPQLVAMRPTQDGRWVAADAGHLAVPADGFGMNRVRRVQGTEMALLLSGVRGSDWAACSDEPSVCLDNAAVLGRVRNRAVRPTLCGPVGFVRQEPLPWAWRESADRTVMPSSVLRLEVSC